MFYGFDIVTLMFWFLILFLILSPTLQYRNLRAARLRILKVLERKYGFRAITMIHRQEKVSIFGIPVYRFIDIDDSEAIIRAIRSTPPNKPIALILHTPGGCFVINGTFIYF